MVQKQNPSNYSKEILKQIWDQSLENVRYKNKNPM